MSIREEGVHYFKGRPGFGVELDKSSILYTYAFY